ncbi:MAG: sugar ABC transporter permease [Treponema sp.]
MNIKILKKNVRNYGMFIALMVVFSFFTIATGGTFMTPRNLSNLFDQTGYVAVLAIGMTLVLIIRQIDLSVGYACGFIGALAALLMRTFPGIPVIVVILVAMVVGLLIGLYQGILVSKFTIPAFVVTLAGMFIFRGALLRITEGTGTVIVQNKVFNALGNGFIGGPTLNIGKSEDALGFLSYKEHFHVITLLFAVALVILMIISSIRERKKRREYNLSDLPRDMFIGKLVFFSALILFFGIELSRFHGLSWTVIIVMCVLAIYHFMLNNTVLGRHIYAVGGNPEAAELSGISVQKITLFVFCSMGALTGLAGILFTARLQSASPAAGNAFELDAIASSYIGGVSASGGVGKVTGTIIGALVLTALQNGMNLMGVGQSYQYVVRGVVLVLAVLFDVRAHRMKV